ncbi:MAG: hybrid sensor histidine kinase/response regulator [Desulfuromonadales bacterium]|nr:hybrid sensor histidine kinase/response regulator [Desulfuromonadales bacterium]MBN2792893.1 hybrid sensor histidine kinase/response regulator [Desulfuromonadales bacterium]
MNNLTNQTKKTLLCVDDEPIIRELCVNALGHYQILVAESGQKALELLENHPVDVVLSDVMMPNMSGLELLQKVKLQQPDLAVVLMTGYSDKDIILEALKAGADDFINKPINILQLSTTVDKVFEKQKIRQELSNLKRIDKLKSDFLGLISHKLKTPATAISLFIQNIADGVESPDDPDFKQMLAMVQTETIHLEQLIQDLLYFSEATLQSDELSLEPVNIASVADQIALALRPAAANRKIDYVINLDPPFSTQPVMLNLQRISFAIRALLDNAIKFTPEGGCVRIEGIPDNERIILSIRDNGVGIPHQELGKIFNKFYQVDPEQTGQVRGFGLGLYYARDFIRSMGGQLTITSAPDNGTEAKIEFPLTG